jgi:hypothetical protein
MATRAKKGAALPPTSAEQSTQEPQAPATSTPSKEKQTMTNSWLDSITAATSSDAFKLIELPSGEYEMTIIKADQNELQRDMTWSDTEYKEGHPFISVVLKPTAVVSVDDEELEECSDWKEKIQSIRILSDHDFKATLVPLFGHAGLDINDYIDANGLRLDDILADITGKAVLVTMERKYNKKREQMYSNVKKIGAVE